MSKILVYAPHYKKLPYSGADERIGRLLNLLKDRHSLTILAGKSIRGHELADGVEIVSLTYSISLLYLLLFGQRYDVILNDSAFPVGLQNEVWQIHDPKIFGGYRKKQRYIRWIINITIRRIKRVLTVSQGSAETIAKKVPGSISVSVFENSISEPFREALIESLRLAPGYLVPKFDAIIVANNMPHKRVNEFVEWLLTELDEKCIFSLAVVGTASELLEARLKEFKDKGLNVSTFVDISYFQLVALYRTSSMLVSNSEMEGYFIPAMEAIACGLPVYMRHTLILESVYNKFDNVIFYDVPDLVEIRRIQHSKFKPDSDLGFNSNNVIALEKCLLL